MRGPRNTISYVTDELWHAVVVSSPNGNDWIGTVL